ncbi:MAG: Subtilase family protein, partial [Candidatus Methanocomedens sp.]
AKNCLSVGASENNRPLISYNYSTFLEGGTTNFPAEPIKSDKLADNIEGIAALSSRAPTDDGRIKPDVVAPGTFIISTRSSKASKTLWGVYNDNENYVYSGGTSMSTPLVAGMAALVRQYYVENESIVPSAALLKATIINGAYNMTPGQYGTSVTQEIQTRPDNAQGWGRVDIERSLFPASPRTMRYHDNISLNASESWDVSYYVNDTSETLKITLVWTDYPAAAYAVTTLVNNLDLAVTGPGDTDYGNGAPDSVNNVEQVELSSPPVGLYTIKVSGTNIPQGPQPFALVISGALDVTPLAITNATAFPTTIEANGSENTTFNITATGPGGIASVTMNLTAIGGLPIQTLDNNSGIWQYTTNTTALGTFHLPVNVTDNTGSSNTSVNITLNTTDTTPPTSNTPSDTEFSANTSASFDKWILTDLHPGYYRVLRNGTEIVPPTSWTNYTNITVLVDTNISLGDFNYTIQYNDTAGNNGTQNTVIITINDTTKPILSDNMPLSGTTNTTPTISINATDRESGINASSANMTVNDVQVLLSNTSSGFTFNFTNRTATTFSHGDTVNVTFNVSDNEGHTTNTSWKFYIDTRAPTITITSPAEGHSTTASSAKVTGTVNGTGSPPTVTVNGVTAVNTINSTTFNGTFNATVSLIVGPNTIYANVTDAAGNTNSTLINVTRTKPDNGGGGGGGGGGGTSGEDFYNIAETETQRVSIFKGDNVSYSFENTQNPILNIKFTAKVSAGKVASKIEVLRNTSTMVDTPPPGKVYQNINIWVGNYGWATEKNIKDLTISFTVPLDWITSNNIDKSSIALYRYNDDSWEQLPTSVTTRNENSITFTSSTPGFSPFAISGETVSTPTVIPIAHDTPAPVATHSSNITSSSQTNEIESGGKAGTIMLWVLFIIVIMAVTVIIYQRKDEILQGINNMRQQRGR